jgi:hypothetical protein
MSGFASKWMLYAAALQAGWAVPAMVAWAVSLGTVFLCVKATSAVFLGPTTEATKDAHESPPTMVWGMGFMAAGSHRAGHCAAVGGQLSPQSDSGRAATERGVQVTWFGLSSDAGSFSTMGGLVLAVVSLVLGGVIYASPMPRVRRPCSRPVAARGTGRRRWRHLHWRRAVVGRGPADGWRLLQHLPQNWHEFFRWSKVDAVYLGVWSGMQAVSRGSGRGGLLDGALRAAALVIALAAAVLAGFKWQLAPTLTGMQTIALPPMPSLLVAACSVAAVCLVLAALSHAS